MLQQLTDRKLLTRFRILELGMLAPYTPKKFLSGNSLGAEVKQSLNSLRQRGI